MTITTAERIHGAPRRLYRLAPAAAAVAALVIAAPARADWRFTPSLGLTQTWTDNLDLLPEPEARTQLVSELAPAFDFALDSRRVKAAASGSFRQFAYRDSDMARPRNDHVSQYAGKLTGVVAEDLLFVDAAASSSRQNLTAFGPQVIDNPYSSLNNTQVKTWSISPYLSHRFGRQLAATVRLTRDGVETDERNRFGDSTADSVSLDLNNDISGQKLTWGLSYLHQDQESELAGDSSVENLNSRLRYRLDSKFALTATAGYDRYDYNALGGRTAGRSWSGGFAWTPSQRTSIEASFGRHFFGKTGSLAASVRSRRTVWSVNYSDGITNTREQFTLPSAIDTTALLDSLFLTSIPDPELRRQAVAAYIQSAGLPPSLADSVNYLSNRYMRQKLLQASAAFKGVRNSALLSLYGNERTALSSQESDSALLGSQLASLNDNVRQAGANATWVYRLSPRSDLSGTASYSRSESLTTGIEDRQRQLRAAFNTKLGRHLTGTVELRRRSGNQGLGIGAARLRDYTEHAIAATLSMTL
ncbi:TIGR03016 family PEP-CTERM system-associated outer membrane protein [uncultured Massilia sp.]|uniref:TIGR03016 family PEP-CTERM system-associated outer membrane protein n=1 Tax=uncultured Massilia sp. TaxID=169973 RepID=UPI0025884B67|nr:TIGR03016 family PEP-CTERM system-associated outer membrane protein [uncultured Massilia sp.]